MNTKKIQINYQTQWTHENLGQQHALHFEPNTPIEIILNRAESTVNTIYPDLKVNYQKSRSSFWKLYRNIISNYRGWHVRYKKPGSQKPYTKITEKIDYKGLISDSTNSDSIKKLLKRPMVWKHQLYPVIDVVKMGPMSSCGDIAKLLNAQLLKSKSNYKILFNFLSSSLDQLNSSYSELEKQAKNCLFSEFENIEQWQPFFNNLNHLYTHCELLDKTVHKPSNINYFDQQVTRSHINSILRGIVKTTKGWSVEFLDEKNE